jgi:hypothetical protein
MSDSMITRKLPYSSPKFERYGDVSDLTQHANGSAHKDGGAGVAPNAPGSRTH